MNEMRFGDITLRVYEDYSEMSKACAKEIADYVRENPNGILGLATGSSPVGAYEELARMHRDEGLSFKGITSFNLDEYYPIDETDEQSYHYFMNEKLFRHIDIKPENTHFPSGSAEDAGKAARDYEKQVRTAGRVGLQLVGIGGNGHIGFNEPGEVFVADTHHVELSESTRQANARFFESIDKVPTHAISMGISTICAAEKIVMVVSGEGKADALKKTVAGNIDPKVSASALKLHRNVLILADKSAAGLVMNG